MRETYAYRLARFMWQHGDPIPVDLIMKLQAQGYSQKTIDLFCGL